MVVRDSLREKRHTLAMLKRALTAHIKLAKEELDRARACELEIRKIEHEIALLLQLRDGK